MPPRRTQIVSTIGPASIGRIPALIAAGMDIARINFAHGTRGDHAQAAASIRVAGQAAGRGIGLLVDLPGPKVRLGAFADDSSDSLTGVWGRVYQPSGGDGARPKPSAAGPG